MKFILLLFVVLSFVSTCSSSSCADGSSCPVGQTCCEIGRFGFGCCPYPEGVCCPDKKHCCPASSQCDTKTEKCQQAAQFTTFFKLAKAQKPDVPCPDGTECPDGSTCCSLASGGYGCCPYPSAACCSDKIHCCPNGYTCDVSKSECLPPQVPITKVSVSSALKNVGDDSCPDGSSCPDGATCCQLVSGGYGCCPYSNADCCSDQLHCCPSGFTCDLGAGTCTPSRRRSLSLVSNPQKTISSSQCANGARCAGDEICCQKGSSGDYGCCPYNPGVCCGDGQNCCPLGYACDLSAGECVSYTSGDRFLVTTASISKK